MSYLLRVSRLLLRLELSRLERRMSPMCFDANLSEQRDRVRAVLEVLR
jgi:hypothetical protein